MVLPAQHGPSNATMRGPLVVAVHHFVQFFPVPELSARRLAAPTMPPTLCTVHASGNAIRRVRRAPSWAGAPSQTSVAMTWVQQIAMKVPAELRTGPLPTVTRTTSSAGATAQASHSAAEPNADAAIAAARQPRSVAGSPR